MKPIGKQAEAEMSFLQHLEELRWHIIRSAVSVIALAVIAFLARPIIFDILIFGPTHNDFITYKVLCRLSYLIGAGDLFCVEVSPIKFINIDVAGQFLVHLKVSLILGFVAAFPYVAWEVWRFVKPGLHNKEASYTQGVVGAASFLFISGILFGYYVLTPFAVSFFSSYQVSALVENNFTLDNYIDFLGMFILTCGMIFELPMIVYFLSKLGLVTPQLMRKYRKHALIINLIVAAIITPADVGTQLLVSIPMQFLYEISIFISARVQRQQEREMAD